MVDSSDTETRVLYSAFVAIAGTLLLFNGPVLTILGWAGGFRLVSQIGIVVVALAAGVVSTLVPEKIGFDTIHLGYLVPFLILYFAMIEGPILATEAVIMLFWPVSVWVTHRVSDSTIPAWAAIVATIASWAGAAVIAVSSTARGPLGLYLGAHLAIVVSLILLLRFSWRMFSAESALSN